MLTITWNRLAGTGYETGPDPVLMRRQEAFLAALPIYLTRPSATGPL